MELNAGAKIEKFDAYCYGVDISLGNAFMHGRGMNLIDSKITSEPTLPEPLSISDDRSSSPPIVHALLLKL